MRWDNLISSTSSTALGNTVQLRPTATCWENEFAALHGVIALLQEMSPSFVTSTEDFSCLGLNQFTTWHPLDSLEFVPKK